MAKRALKWTAGQVFEFLARDFPQAMERDTYTVERLEPERAAIRLAIAEAHLRPGGSISGPTLMGLVDFTAYVLLLAHHGAAARLAVTSGLHISFLRKVGLEDVVCEVELLKHGRTLSVAEARITAADGRLVAHAEATYFMAAAGSGS